MTTFKSEEHNKLYKRLIELSDYLYDLAGFPVAIRNGKLDSPTADPLNKSCKEFFTLCDEVSTKTLYLPPHKKKIFYDLISQIHRDLSNLSEEDIDCFANRNHDLQFRQDEFTEALRTGKQKIYSDNQVGHYYKASTTFLSEYIKLKNSKDHSIENYREFITNQISGKVNLSQVKLIGDNQTIQHHYNSAFALKKRGKIKEANQHFEKVQVFIDQEAFKHYVIAGIAYGVGDYSTYKGFNKIKNSKLCNLTTLSNPDEAFEESFIKFISEAYHNNYTELLINAYNRKLNNPFNFSNHMWQVALNNFPYNHAFYTDHMHQWEFIDSVENPDLRREIRSSSCNPLTNRELENLASSKVDIPGFDENRFNENCPGWDDIVEGDFAQPLFDFVTSNSKPSSQKTAIDQEKPVITTPPDLNSLVRINIPSQPSAAFDGKPVIADQVDLLDNLLKDQLTDQTSEALKLQNMLQLPPSQISSDQSLGNTILCATTLKTLSAGKSNVFIVQVKATNMLSPKMAPGLAYTNNKLPNLFFKSPANTTQAVAGYKNTAHTSKKIVPVSESTNRMSVKQVKPGVKGGMATFVVFVGLETLHARLENEGRADLAAFVPVPKHFRPWGEAFFSTLDRNLFINPNSGHSTTKLFTHVADGTAYVFTAIDNTTRTIGKSEEAIYKNMLSKKTTGFDASRFGIITGILEGSTVFIDTVGGSFDKRRAQAQKEFDKQASTLPPNFVIWENWAKLCLNNKNLPVNKISAAKKNIKRPNIHSKSQGWVSMKVIP